MTQNVSQPLSRVIGDGADFCQARIALAADRGPGMWPASPLSVDCPRCTQKSGLRCNEVDRLPVDWDKVAAAFGEMRAEAAKIRNSGACPGGCGSAPDLCTCARSDVEELAALLAGPDADAATVAMAEALAKCASDITHENGTPEATRAAYWGTIRDAVRHFSGRV